MISDWSYESAMTQSMMIVMDKSSKWIPSKRHFTRKKSVLVEKSSQSHDCLNAICPSLVMMDSDEAARKKNKSCGTHWGATCRGTTRGDWFGQSEMNDQKRSSLSLSLTQLTD